LSVSEETFLGVDSFEGLLKVFSEEDEEIVAIDSIAAATNSFSPLLTNIGFGGIVGFLIGFIMEKLLKYWL
jgi:hypothetical protein